MTKADTQLIKGIAILMMLFLHLFSQMGNVDLCKTFISIHGVPFVNLLTRAANPVPFFLILSGYGLFVSYSSGVTKSSGRRVLKIFIHYWITLAIFIPIGAFVCGTNVYPGSFLKFVENISGWNTSYNQEVWFLFPYCLLVFVSPFVFCLINRFHWAIVFIISGFLYFGTYVVIHFYGHFLWTRMLIYMPLLFFNCQFSFVVGMLIAKWVDFKSVKESANRKGAFLPWLVLLMVVIVRLCLKVDIFNPLYAALFIVLFASATHSVIGQKFLVKFGQRSTTMWFVHTYFCYYMFHDFIYSFKYPLAIYSVLISLSYLVAVIVDSIRNLLFIRLGLNK